MTETHQADPGSTPPPHQARRAWLMIGLALLVPILPFLAIGELPGERWLSAADENALAFALTGAGLLAADVLLPIPSSVVGTLLGARLGLLPGLLACWGGLMAGSLIGYLGGRFLLGRIEGRLPEAPTAVALFLSRPVPVFAEALSLAAGAQRMRPTLFAAVTAAGNLVYAGALAANGAALLPSALVGPGLIVPMLLPVAAWLLWRRFARHGESGSAAAASTAREGP